MAELKIETLYDIYTPESYPIRIGRAVDNDIVLRALGVADYHVLIEQSGEGLQIRNLHEAELNGKPIRSRVLLHNNSSLTLGSSRVKLWLNTKAPMPNPSQSGKWKIFTHPACAAIWFFMALALPMWMDYLRTQTRYVMNWYLLFMCTVIILGLVWMMHSMILPLVRRYLLVPLIGIVSALSFFSDMSDQIVYWLAFQFGIPWLDLASLLLMWFISLVIFRSFFRDFIPLAGRLLNRYTVAISLPCLFLLLYNFLLGHDFFAHRAGSYPNYHQALVKDKLPMVEEETIASFLSIEKTD